MSTQHSQFHLLKERRFLPFFIVQTLGAFNDNVFKNALVILVTFGVAGLSSGQINLYVNLAAGLFILPFFLFSATAGQIADKYDKARLMRLVKLLEMSIMTLGLAGFAMRSLPLLFAVLMLMGLHSTVFGPIKYAILPEQLGEDELVGGNAIVESATFLAILIGTILGGWVITQDGGALWAGATTIGIATLGYLAARKVPSTPAAEPGLRVNWNAFTETWRNLKFLRGNRTVFLSILGVSWFWFYGAIFLAQLPNYTKDYLGGGASVVTLLLTVFSLGIGLGSLACERLANGEAIGLVPLGSIGMTAFGVDLYFAVPQLATVHDLSAVAFLHGTGHVHAMVDLLLIGISGGLYIVPLFSLVQSRSEPTHRSRIIAGNNILNALFMVVSAVLAIVLLKIGFGIPQLLLTVALLNAAVAIYIYSLVTEFLLQFLVWILVSALYRIDRRGLENIPRTGPAIVICNHVTFIDALIVGGCVHRPVRFVMDHNLLKIPLLGPIFKMAKTIPIAPAKEDPALLERAYAEIDQALADGDLIGLFPEGGLTRDGEMQTFRSGLNRIVTTRPVPVIPMALSNLWGSMWSRRDSALRRMRLPRRFRAQIRMTAGQLLMPELRTAASTGGFDLAAMRELVLELRGEAR